MTPPHFPPTMFDITRAHDLGDVLEGMVERRKIKEREGQPKKRLPSNQ